MVLVECEVQSINCAFCDDWQMNLSIVVVKCEELGVGFVLIDCLDSRFLVLTKNAINHFCCLTHSNTAFYYKATFAVRKVKSKFSFVFAKQRYTTNVGLSHYSEE